MSINVKLFGSLADKIGKPEISVSDCQDTDLMKSKVLAEYPQLKDCVFLISVNKSVIKSNHKLETGSEVAFLPPFAGG